MSKEPTTWQHQHPHAFWGFATGWDEGKRHSLVMQDIILRYMRWQLSWEAK